MNTKITILYRDGHNYKNSTSYILNGLMSESDWDLLNNSMIEGFFVPNELGLNNPAFHVSNEPDFPNKDIDHGWCAISAVDDGLSYGEFINDAQTKDQSTCKFDAHTFCKAVAESPKDASAEWTRMLNS